MLLQKCPLPHRHAFLHRLCIAPVLQPTVAEQGPVADNGKRLVAGNQLEVLRALIDRHMFDGITVPLAVMNKGDGITHPTKKTGRSTAAASQEILKDAVPHQGDKNDDQNTAPLQYSLPLYLLSPEGSPLGSAGCNPVKRKEQHKKTKP